MNASPNESQDALTHHIQKWQRREPEMAVAEVFCPVAQRPLFLAWGALLFELREAMFELSDARVTAVKTGWWAETLITLGKGEGRHPLTDALTGHVAPWGDLARAVITTPQLETRPATIAQAIDDLLPLARTVSAVEAVLFNAATTQESERAIAAHFLLQRLPMGLGHDDRARIPMNLLARHGLTSAQLSSPAAEPLLRDWAREVVAVIPPHLSGASLFRRLRGRFDHARWQRLADGKGFTAPLPVVSVYRAWRAARQH